MKKYLVDKKNTSFLREYVVFDDRLKLFLADGSFKEIDNTLENIKYLDDLMLEQYYEYDKDSLVSFSGTNFAISSGLAVGTAITFASDGVSDGMELSNSAKMGSVLGAGVGVATSYLIATSKAKNALLDYEKDSLFVENRDLFELYLSSTNFCNGLSKKTREKVSDVCGRLSLNVINDFKLSEIKEIYLKIINYNDNNEMFVDRDNVRIRK